MDYSGVETARLKDFEITLGGGAECRLSATDDHRVEKQVTFVDVFRVIRLRSFRSPGGAARGCVAAGWVNVPHG